MSEITNSIVVTSTAFPNSLQREDSLLTMMPGPTNTDFGKQTTFVGNTPSAVLFFLAIAVGVAIACLFIFFTIRYFVRSRYGFQMYTVSSRGVLFSSGLSNEVNDYHYSNREIREHLQYLRNHHFIRDEFLERRLFSASGRRRRRGRFSKMKKLMPSEVEELFPKTTYADWLTSESEQAKLQQAELTSSVETKGSTVPVDRSDVVELQELEVKHSDDENDILDHVITFFGEEGPVHKPTENGSRDNSGVSDSMGEELHKMHFDSGSCTICLDAFEPEELVRGLICGHVYHSDCLDPWLTRRRACCPMCKRDYYKENNVTVGANADPTSIIVEGASAHDRQSTMASNIEFEAPETSTEEGNTAPDAENGGNNAENNNDSTLDILNDELNHDYLRHDSHIQALFNELIPLSERVRVILEEHPEMDLDARAREVAGRKYGTLWRVFFWKLMGISKEGLYQWAVLDLYQSERRNSRQGSINLDAEGSENNPETSEGGTAASETNQPPEPVEPQEESVTATTTVPAAGTTGATMIAENSVRSGEDIVDEIEMADNSHVFYGDVALNTPYGNTSELSDDSEVDLSVVRREAVERHV